MNENPNVKNEESPQEIFEAVSALVNELINTHPVSSQTVSSASAPSTSNPTPKNAKANVQASTVRHERTPQLPQVYSRQSNLLPTYEIFRTSTQFAESQSDVAVEQYLARLHAAKTRPPAPSPSPPCMPPSYSTVIKQGRPSLDIRRDVRSMEMQHISPFSRIPPPSYNQIHRDWSREISNNSSEEILLGPDPIYIWCSHCATVVITVTQAQRSKFTHITAAALCLFGCWPCAMLPYCMNSCKNIYHYCPDCNYLFGMYRPW